MQVTQEVVDYFAARKYSWDDKLRRFHAVLGEAVEDLTFRDIRYYEALGWVAIDRDPIIGWESPGFTDPVSAYAYAETAGWQ